MTTQPYRVNGDMSITVFGTITGSILEVIKNHYNYNFGWSLPGFGDATGQVYSPPFLWNLIWHIRNKVGILGSWDTSNCIPPQYRGANGPWDLNNHTATDMTWYPPVMSRAEYSLTCHTGDTSYTVPHGVRCMRVNLLLAGGGGGGFADGIDMDYGGWTARGGGSGAFVRGAHVRVNEGDVVTVNIGGGGAGGKSGPKWDATGGGGSSISVWRPSDNRTYKIFDMGGGGPGYKNSGINGADWWKHYDIIGGAGGVISAIGDASYHGNHTFWGDCNGRNNAGQPGADSIYGSRGCGGGAHYNCIPAWGYGSGGGGAGYTDFKHNSTRWDGSDGMPGIGFVDFLVAEPSNVPIWNVTDGLNQNSKDGIDCVFNGGTFVYKNGTDPFSGWEGDSFRGPETPIRVPNEANYVLVKWAASGGSDGQGYGNGATGAWVQDVCIDISGMSRPVLIRMKDINSIFKWGYVNGPLHFYVNDRKVFDLQPAGSTSNPGKINETIDWGRTRNGNGSNGGRDRNHIPGMEAYGIGYGGGGLDNPVKEGGPAGCVLSYYQTFNDLPQGLNVIRL